MMILIRPYTWLALLSGVFASLASVFSKLAFGDVSPPSCETIMKWMPIESLEVPTLDVPFRILMIVCLVLCNVLMWLLFSKAMSRSPTTVEVTIINTASNFLMSAWFGKVFFHETFSIIWYIGVSLIIIGLIIIHKSSSTGDGHSKDE